MISGTTLSRGLLVVAPHPDDETIGAWQLIRKAMRAGGRVTVVVASDGGASHPGSARWPRARLVRARRRETLRAMRTLGITPASVHFLDLPDGGLAGYARDLDRALSLVAARCGAGLIVGPVAADAHADHRAVAEALDRRRRNGGKRLGYQVWPEDRRRSHRWRVPLDGAARAAKRRAVLSYRTQTGTITDAIAGFALTHRHLRAFVRPAECFVALG